MKIKIQAQQLSNQIALADSVAKMGSFTKNTPAVMLYGHNERIYIYTSDMAAGIYSRVEAVGEFGQGEGIVLPVAGLVEYLQTLGSAEIEIESKGARVRVSHSGGNAEFALLGEALEWQDAPEINGAAPLSRDVLLSALQWVGPSVAVDESRPVLMGVLLRPSDSQTSVVASDGYRLSLRQIPTKSSLKSDLLIPFKPLITLLKGANSESVLFWHDEQSGRLWCDAGGTIFYIRLIAGDFPDYQKIMPQKTTHNVVVDREELASSLRGVSVFSRLSSNIVFMEFAKGKLRLSSQDAPTGTASATVDVEYQGSGIKAAFNYRYLLEYLKAAPTKSIVVGLNEPLAPVRFSGEEEADVHIIMPVRA